VAPPGSAAPEWPAETATLPSGIRRSVAAAGPCAEERRIADERCEGASRARARADAAVDALRTAQRSYDRHEAAAAAALDVADPRVIRTAKEEAHAAFRAAASTARTTEAHEAAARDWVHAVNRINRDARHAAATVARERAASRDIVVHLERLSLEADTARITAGNADAACLAARSVLADCDELAASERPGTIISPVAGAPGRIHVEEDETLGIALEAGGRPFVFRLLEGDRVAMHTIVTSLAGGDVDERRHWLLLVTRLIEAITADAIEASALDLPDDHPFWGMFTRTERRQIAQALASQGYRFDGLGGWIDARQPSKRDLSLAVGYAGLDPMRVRNWPSDQAIESLFTDATVAADEHLASRAGDMTLGEMVTMLGRRADGLTEVWNAWGKIRPLMLSES
jgi:hypothetical protein